MGVARLAFALALGSALVVGCGPAIPPAGNYATVSGHVTDATSGIGISGASVVVNSVLSATTDAAGAYRIVTVPTGPWSYTVGATNYATVSASNPQDLLPGEARVVNFPLAHR